MLHKRFQPLTLLLALSMLLGACKKDSTDTAAIEAQKKVDEAAIQAYVAAQNLTATRTSSGLYYVTQTPGTGTQAAAGKSVTVHYRGYLLEGTADGRKFDSSYDRSEPFTFQLGAGRVIPGWDEGVALMKKGETARFIIPSYLAYGSTGSGTIPSNSVLIFYINLLDVQ